MSGLILVPSPMYSWERVRVRVISDFEQPSTFQITLTLALSRSTGRGDQREFAILLSSPLYFQPYAEDDG